MKVILYTTHCPRCNVLTKKLNAKGVEFSEIEDTNVMESKGYLEVPVLEVDDVAMDFKQANDWINSLEEK